MEATLHESRWRNTTNVSSRPYSAIYLKAWKDEPTHMLI